MDLLGGAVDAFKLGYNLYTNKRDYDYQKALQQQIFQREDTSVQRRVEDLKAAGINPNLAAGSGAGAGAVVSRSNTNDLGSALDTVQAINSIRAQRQQVENAKVENQILENNKEMQAYELTLEKANLFNQLGLPYGIRVREKDGKMDLNFAYYNNSKTDYENMPLRNIFKYQLDNMKNAASILDKQNNWYTTQQITDMVGSVIGDIADIGGLFKPKFYKGKFVK